MLIYNYCTISTNYSHIIIVAIVTYVQLLSPQSKFVAMVSLSTQTDNNSFHTEEYKKQDKLKISTNLPYTNITTKITGCLMGFNGTSSV